MSRWRQDPDGAAADLVRRSLANFELTGRILLANAGPALRQALRDGGRAPTSWSRRATDLETATPWPSGGPFDTVLLRHAKARDEQEMNAHAALSVLVPGGRLILCGGNDEGIRSVSALFEELCGPVETLSTRGHGRIVSARRPDRVAGLMGELQAWRRIVKMPIGGVDRDWATYPGVFSSDHMDAGTRLMLTALPRLGARARVLDYGCGSGVIAAGMRAALPEGHFDLLDADSLALLAASENVAGARIVLGTSLAAAGLVRYDAILSNPPLHTGIAEDHRALEALIAGAPKILRRGGLLQLVVQRRVPLGAMLAEHLSDPAVVAEDTVYRVWRAASR